VVGIGISFDLGRYHANPWGANVNDAATELPPSPWRLLRALYATARTDVRLTPCRAAIDRALAALVDAPPPVFELPPTTAAHTRHYVPLAGYTEQRPKDKTRLLDGFLAIDPEAELAVWWDVALDAEAADALAQTVRSLGYLGRSESVCSARLLVGAGPTRPSAEPARLADAREGEWELVELLCPRRGAGLEPLTVSVTEMRRSRCLTPPDSEGVTYAVASPGPSPQRPLRRIPDVSPTLALFSLRGSARPAIAEAVVVGQALRAALQNVYGGQNDGAASPTFSGRSGDRPRDDQHRHAHYLTLPGGRSRRIDRLVVWAPEGFRQTEVTALAGVGYLSVPGIPDRLPLALAALGREPQLELPELLEPARSWRSATPFGLVRHPKVRGGELRDSPADQVRRELARRGLPAPREVGPIPGAWHRFRSARAGQSRLARASVLGVHLEFEEPVPGPLALGALCHFGLGLFTPSR
jgi:CRISPR-associated protein Csb2